MVAGVVADGGVVVGVAVVVEATVVGVAGGGGAGVVVAADAGTFVLAGRGVTTAEGVGAAPYVFVCVL